MSEDNLLRFLNYYTDINPNWLLLGIEPMILEKKEEVSTAVVISKNEENPYKLLYELQKENAELLKEIGDLKLENERLKKRTCNRTECDSRVGMLVIMYSNLMD